MMEIIESISTSPASDESINLLENLLRCKLPDDYRSFLKTLNGGRPSPRNFKIFTSEGKENAAIQFFFTTDKQGKPYIIFDKLDVYKNRMPIKLLPIACDSFGNIVLLDVGAKTIGAIYFWDHEKENMNDDDPTWDNISTVAPSFTSFVEGLT